MKRNQVNAILIDQVKRKKHIFKYILLITFLAVLAISFLLIYIDKNKNYYVSYKETSDLNYQVFLKQNDFFAKNYLEKDNQYIVSLIDYIRADFNYELSMEEKDINYQYSYKIDAEVKVKEKNTNYVIYSFTNNILNVDNKQSNSNYNVKINEQIDIDYNYYNNLIQKFVNVYDLDDVESTLEINMYVNAVGSCDDFEQSSDNNSVISLSIPLTTKTMAIDINHDLVDSDENVMACKKDSPYSFMFIILSIILILIDIYLTFNLVRYILMTRTAETIYEKELKKILNNYRSYIQKVNNDFDLKSYQVLKVDTFTDMLEIRDTIQEPILMVESKERQGTYFLIPSKTKILYMYGLKVKDIKSQMEQNTIEKK